jgi:hypothetical protein
MQTKRPHTLHSSKGPVDFLLAFESETGLSLHSFIERFVDSKDVSAVILAGSIPLGLATSASDLDLIVLLQSENNRPMPSASTHPEVIYAAERQGGSTTLEARQVVAMLNGVEVDAHFLSAQVVADLSKRIARAGVLLTSNETCFMSRIKTGWVLTQTEGFSGYVGRLLRDNSLEIHTTTNNLVGALQELEDARVALADSHELALHLGRCSVEKCFMAYLSARGYAYPGGKWLRLLRLLEPLRPQDSDSYQTLMSHGVNLLFPTTVNREVAENYLTEVAEFFRSVKELIEIDRTFKVAFALCPQIHEPAHC